ncbi:DUF3304 domain-containing protein [Burkholderia multivorans]|uniref:DUF3304 domain-containing protein n=1 Tax=Burkholderia multivorans TaxID=87883 RepID=UPI0021591528|nr:DUF3304 domain-containing protein [Burkholderia multivorans]
MNITVRRYFLLLLIGSLLLTMIGCSDSNERNPSSVSGYNYTDYYIDQFLIAGEGHEMSAGGSNILPKETGKLRSESGGSCCIGIPARWRPNMKLVVKWNVDKVLDGKHLGTWYTAPPRCRRMGRGLTVSWCMERPHVSEDTRTLLK